MEEKNKRRRISSLEVRTLRLIYQYRFVTAALIAGHGLFNDPSNARRHLTRLCELGLIGVRYDKSYRLAGRPGAYYLKSAGIKVLRYAGEEIESAVTHLISKDGDASDRFEAHCLRVLETANVLRGDSPNVLVFTKSMLYAFDSVLQPLPDMFVQLSNKHFYIEFVDEAIPGFAIKKRLNQYIEDFEENEWEENGSYYPPLVFVTVTKAQFVKLKKKVYGFIKQADTDLPVYGFNLESAIEHDGAIYALPMSSFDAPGSYLNKL